MSHVDKTSRTVQHFTPPFLTEVTRRYAKAIGYDGIELDVATSEDNWTRAGHFFTGDPIDGLAVSWNTTGRPLRSRDYLGAPGTFVWMNSPWGDEIRGWVEKAVAEAREGRATVVTLLPGQRFEQRYWQESLIDDPALTRAIVAIAGRLPFFGRVCVRCKKLEGDDVHGSKKKPATCAFEWSGERRSGMGNPYGSFLYLLGRGHDVDAAFDLFSEVGHVFTLGRTRRFAPPTGSTRARMGRARKTKALFDGGSKT